MIGKTVSHYRIIEKLGAGGMGVVYRAQDTHLERSVAIKVLPAEAVLDPDRQRRFVQVLLGNQPCRSKHGTRKPALLWLTATPPAV